MFLSLEAVQPAGGAGSAPCWFDLVCVVLTVSRIVSEPDCRSVSVLVSELFPWLCTWRQAEERSAPPRTPRTTKEGKCSLSSDWQAEIKTAAAVCGSLQDQSGSHPRWHLTHCCHGDITVTLSGQEQPGPQNRAPDPEYSGLHQNRSEQWDEWT